MDKLAGHLTAAWEMFRLADTEMLKRQLKLALDALEEVQEGSQFAISAQHFLDVAQNCLGVSSDFAEIGERLSDICQRKGAWAEAIAAQQKVVSSHKKRNLLLPSDPASQSALDRSKNLLERLMDNMPAVKSGPKHELPSLDSTLAILGLEQMLLGLRHKKDNGSPDC